MVRIRDWISSCVVKLKEFLSHVMISRTLCLNNEIIHGSDENQVGFSLLKME